MKRCCAVCEEPTPPDGTASPGGVACAACARDAMHMLMDRMIGDANRDLDKEAA